MTNVMNWALACAMVIGTSVFHSSTACAQWGTIKGQVVANGKIEPLKPLYAAGDASVKDPSVCAVQDIPDESLVVDPESKGVANVLVWLIKKPAKIHPDLAKSKEKELTFDQKGCKFIPHVLLVRTDQHVRVVSGDDASHNTHTFALKNQQYNFIVGPKDRKGNELPLMTLEERLPFEVKCDIHSWMKAYWLVLDHPYSAVTNEKGEFEIANLPAGDHEFRVWQEKCGYVEKTYKVTVKDGENKLPPIKVDPAMFLKK